MSAAQSPTQTTTSHSVEVVPIRYDPAYVRCVPGILKIVCIVLSLLGFICIEVSNLSYHSRGGFFNTVAMTAFWFTGIMLAFYVFHVNERFYRIPWMKIEMWFCIIWTLLYCIASSLAAAFGTYSEAYTAAAFFGFCAMVAYGYDAFLKFRCVQSGVIVENARTVPATQPPQTTVTITTY